MKLKLGITRNYHRANSWRMGTLAIKCKLNSGITLNEKTRPRDSIVARSIINELWHPRETLQHKSIWGPSDSENYICAISDMDENSNRIITSISDYGKDD
ncbi:MAG TPA: hypothetical protein DCW90_08735 [Lachnospiraceae bacterium]|nr:hypothetical protein [Lachnospiraceae bacterium]